MKNRVRLRLAQCPVPVYLFMPMQNGMGEATLDFIGCIGGLFFAVETKAERGLLTPRQVHTKARMEAAGAVVFVLNEEPAGWAEFEAWLTRATAISALEHREPRLVRFPQWATELLNEEVCDGSC
jgi:hypothetical protein